MDTFLALLLLSSIFFLLVSLFDIRYEVCETDMALGSFFLGPFNTARDAAFFRVRPVVVVVVTVAGAVGSSKMMMGGRVTTRR